jgi:hypothetical protein
MACARRGYRSEALQIADTETHGFQTHSSFITHALGLEGFNPGGGRERKRGLGRDAKGRAEQEIAALLDDERAPPSSNP